MGYSTCPPINHPDLHRREVKVCWRCDRCPKEHGFRLMRGDYCPTCTAEMRGKGLVWSPYYKDYVEPPLVPQTVVVVKP